MIFMKHRSGYNDENSRGGISVMCNTSGPVRLVSSQKKCFALPNGPVPVRPAGKCASPYYKINGATAD